jgi:hypothetical protein
MRESGQIDALAVKYNSVVHCPTWSHGLKFVDIQSPCTVLPPSKNVRKVALPDTFFFCLLACQHVDTRCCKVSFPSHHSTPRTRS